MKKIFTLLTLSFLISSTNLLSQNTTTHDEWKVLNGKNAFYLYNPNGSGVENFDEIPDFTIVANKDDDGVIGVRFDAAYIYRYEKDKNFVSIEFIIDKSEIIAYSGEIRKVDNDNKTRVYISRKKGQMKFFDLFEMMENGSKIYVRLTGGGEPIVFKYSLKGFTEGWNKMKKSFFEWSDDNDNPFNSTK
tara:strand:+ start:3970 stop:4536 length:567 start_codon:yes stop_codon:yes gene_type:complete